MTTDTDDSTPGPIQPGLWVHFYRSRSVPVSTAFYTPPLVIQYGSELELTADIIEAAKDRHGNSWLDFLDDEPAQVEMFGAVVVRRGHWPIGVLRIEPGSREWNDLREAERQRAHRDSASDKERNSALRLVNHVFGPPPVLNKTIREVPL